MGGKQSVGRVGGTCGKKDERVEFTSISDLSKAQFNGNNLGSDIVWFSISRKTLLFLFSSFSLKV